MSSRKCPYSPSIDCGLLLLRVTTSVLILFHGFSHLKTGASGVKKILANLGLPEFLAYGSLIGEIVAPLLILFGVFARLGGAILAFNMLVAILTAHATQLCQLSSHGGWAVELPALYLFAGATIMFTGAGKYTLLKG